MAEAGKSVSSSAVETARLPRAQAQLSVTEACLRRAGAIAELDALCHGWIAGTRVEEDSVG